MPGRAPTPSSVGHGDVPPGDRPGRFAVGLAAITAVGAALRLWDLGGISIWGDELFGAREAIRLGQLDVLDSLEGIVGHLVVLVSLLGAGVDVGALDPNDYASFADAGITPTALRVGPVLVGALTVPVVGLLARPVLGSRQSLVLAGLLAIAPWHLYWSQGSRFYAPQFLFYAIAFFAYYRATDPRAIDRPTSDAGAGDDPRAPVTASAVWLVVAMGAFVLAFNAQYTSFVFGAVVAVDWLAGRWRGRPIALGRGGWSILVVALGVSVASPLVLLLSSDAYTAAHFGASAGNPPAQIASAIVLFVHPVVVGAAVLSAMMGQAMAWRLRIYLVAGAFLPIVVISTLSFRNYSGSRYGFVALLPMLALVAVGVVHLHDLLTPRLHRLAALTPLLLVVGVMVMVDVDFYTGNRGFRPRWDEAVGLVADQLEPGERMAIELTQVGSYLLADVDTDGGVVIGVDEIVDEANGVWVVTPRWRSRALLADSVVEPGHFVQTLTTDYVVPRHQIDVWYRPPVDGSTRAAPEPVLEGAGF